jgi:hypothetical protein
LLKEHSIELTKKERFFFFREDMDSVERIRKERYFFLREQVDSTGAFGAFKKEKIIFQKVDGLS